MAQFKASGGDVHVSCAGDQFLLVLPKNLGQAWNDVRIRQALALAIDRKAINRIVYGERDGWTGNDTHTAIVAPLVAIALAVGSVLRPRGPLDTALTGATLVAYSLPEFITGTIQAQVLDLMRRLQAETGVAYLFISHDLAVVSEMADDIMVLHRGRVHGYGPAATLLANPADPYTRALVDAFHNRRPGAEGLAMAGGGR